MSIEQDAADILDGFVSLDGNDTVPDAFAEFVADRIANRPSPAAYVDPLTEIRDKLDEILTLLRGGE